MSSTFLNRLIGTIILVALIVILLPELLDGEKRTNAQEFVVVPPTSETLDDIASNASESSTASTGNAQTDNPQNSTLREVDRAEIESQVITPVDIVEEPALDDVLSQNQEQTADLSSQSEADDLSEPESEPETQAGDNDKQADIAAEEPEPSTQGSQQVVVNQPAYVVQLGSFRHKKNVDELIKKLQQAGYKAYTRPITTSAGQLNKVFVGPEVDRQALEQSLPKLYELTRLKGKITAFEVSAQ